tara:strand:+ start:253 stop:993 length:741 start_codon:yes stop_codon:yes gene_type:complete
MKLVINIIVFLSLCSLSIPTVPIAILAQATSDVRRCISNDCNTISQGALLFPNDIVITSKNSFSKVRFLDSDIDINLHDNSKMIINGNRNNDILEKSIMFSYGKFFIATFDSGNIIQTPHLSLLDKAPSILYINIDGKNNETVHVINGELYVEENSFIENSTTVSQESMIMFNKTVSFPKSPKRIVKSILSNEILFNENISSDILKRYNLLSKTVQINESGTILIPIRSTDGDFKNLIIEYYVDKK